MKYGKIQPSIQYKIFECYFFNRLKRLFTIYKNTENFDSEFNKIKKVKNLNIYQNFFLNRYIL